MDARLVRYLESLGFTADALDGWTVNIAQRDGRDVGCVLTCGPEVHMLAFEDMAMSRKNIIEHLSPLFDQFGYCTTRVPVSETDHKLRHVLGFKETWRDDRFIYFAATELPFRRKHHA